MIAVLEKRRKAMTVFVRVERGHRLGFPACRADAHQRAGVQRAEDDDVRWTPRAAAAVGRIADFVDVAVRDRDLLQLAIRKKRELPAVRRPERKRRALRARQKPRIERHCANPESSEVWWQRRGDVAVTARDDGRQGKK